MREWWTDPRLKCPPETMAEFEADRAHVAEYGCTSQNRVPRSKMAKRIEARWLDLQADASERARNKRASPAQFWRDPAEVRVERAEREFERALGLRTR